MGNFKHTVQFFFSNQGFLDEDVHYLILLGEERAEKGKII